MRCVPIWYGDRWVCPCGFETEKDLDAWWHYKPKEFNDPVPADILR